MLSQNTHVVNESSYPFLKFTKSFINEKLNYFSERQQLEVTCK